uniref:Uncharacterized protein n=1 Tax=viral metagenome TaxID=1070528 RepID=A0A6H1ZFG4_9ZZZZ
MKGETVLELFNRGVQTIITDKFAKVLIESERDGVLRATIFSTIGSALGETLGEVKYPKEWQRLLKRKDCPAYMKKIVTREVNAYYPKLSLPEEPHWVTFGTEHTVV